MTDNLGKIPVDKVKESGAAEGARALETAENGLVLGVDTKADDATTGPDNKKALNTVDP